MTPTYRAQLQEELLRAVVTFGAAYTAADGSKIHGATETETIKHLTSGRDYFSGRQYRFPGIGDGWRFESAIVEAGFRVVEARNYRGQKCRVVTL